MQSCRPVRYSYGGSVGMFGGKNGAGVYQAIINLMPPHDTYIEPFLGSGAVMRRKAPAVESIGIDPDLSAITNFKCDYPVDLLVTDAILYLETLVPHGKTVIYCDPPYVHSTRKSRHRYRYELTDDDHRRLVAALKQIPCYILVSGYYSELYGECLEDWHTVSFQASVPDHQDDKDFHQFGLKQKPRFQICPDA